MGKPSIFSKEYEKKMRKRRIRNVVLIIVSILIVGAIIFRGYLGNTFYNIKNISLADIFKKHEAKKEDVVETKKEEGSKSEVKKEETKETKKEESIEIQLANGAKVVAIYEVRNNEKFFTSINPGDNKVSYSISPSGKKIVVFDDTNQNIYIANEVGEVKDVTMKNYTTSTGEFTIAKDTQLASNPSYMWHSLPKFVDDTHIAYISQLPWLNKDDKYLWIIDLNTISHSLNYNAQGKNILLGNTTDKGLEIKLDNGETKYIQGNGNVQ